MAAAIIALHASPLSSHFSDFQKLKETVAAYGAMGWLVFTAASAVLIAVGFPRLAVCGVAGFLFGFTKGIVLTQISAVAAAYATFLFVRWTGVHWATERLAKHRVIRALLHAHSPWSVFVVRQLPVHGFVLNALFAVTQVSHRDFLIGSFFGFLPYATVATLVGSGVGKHSHAVAQLGCASVIAVASTLAVLRLRRRLANDTAAPTAEHDGHA